jgi:hypothetical protein
MNTIQDLGTRIVASEKSKLEGRIVNLRYSDHAKSRLVERTTGKLIVAPTWVKLSEKNIVEVRPAEGRIKSVMVKLDYKPGIYMYLAIALVPGVVKTVYFEEDPIKKRKRLKKDRRFKANELKQKCEEIKEALQEPRTEIRREEGIREDVGSIQPIMERTTFTQKMLGLWHKYIWRKS